MRQLTAIGILLGTLGGCSLDQRTPELLRADAARADSSAAGYEVGPLVVATAGTASTGSTVHLPHPSSDAGASRGITGATNPPRQVTAVEPRMTGRDTATVGPVSTPRTTPRPTSGLAPLDTEREKDFLVSDAEHKTAVFQLTAGTELTDRVSFNAATRGARVLTIPLGWKVTIAFVNRDPELPHSALVVGATNPVPEELAAPAFPGARTVKIDEGLLEGDSDEISFTADRAGRYLLACGVMGHAQRGQWLLLTVSDSAAHPSYR